MFSDGMRFKHSEVRHLSWALSEKFNLLESSAVEVTINGRDFYESIYAKQIVGTINSVRVQRTFKILL